MDTELDALVAVSDTPWSNFTASDYTIEQWRRACLLKMPGGDPEAKSTFKLPVREPSGALNRNGVHAAAAALAGARGGVDAPAAAKESARRKLRGLYRQLGEEPPESLAAAITEGPLVATEPAVTAAPGTRDGPGWLTHPRDTQRLRDYWTRGTGAAKIRWGQSGDFDRCRKQLRKYVTPPFLAGTCANLHFVALGFWPNQGPHAGKHGHRGLHADGGVDEYIEYEPGSEETTAVTAAFAAAADLDQETAPLEWFQEPGLDGPTPLTVTDDGEVLGHLATWGTCHVGISGACTEAPRSRHDYAYFRTGEVSTAGGPVAVGNITMDTGHADTAAGPTAAISHYDDTGTVVADVAAGEDRYGIWVHGRLRPGVTHDQVHALKAGALSGDWRRIAGNLELVAALVVNVPGFPIPRTEMAASAGVEFALVAAAVVTTDPNAVTADRIAVAVVNKLAEKGQAEARRQRAEAVVAAANALRAEALAAALVG